MEFSQILPSNFFNVFYNKHRDLYIEALIRIYQRYEVSSILGMPKEEARDIVEDLLNEKEVGIKEFLEDDEDEEIPNYRELANYFLRRLEITGWITIDINNDYSEILNFNNYSISLILAFIEIKKDSTYSLFADNFSFENEEKAFRGYIFTIYSLLNSKTYDYGLMINQVYKNTISFVREIRKVDHKLKEFIQLIDTKDNLKDLVELLSEYKDEVMDKAYFKLKTFDNINKYKLEIIKKLENILENPDIMSICANDYMFISDNDSQKAMFLATKQINDCIDIYNELEVIMDEIDKKNRDYISQTLSKVKYLLNDSNDIAGLLNYITKYYANKVKQGKEESAYKHVSKMFTVNTTKLLLDSSLSQPRGTYTKTFANELSKTRLDFSMFKDAFFESFKSSFSEKDAIELLNFKLNGNESKTCKDFIEPNASKDDIIKLLYLIIYASQMNEYEISMKESYYETNNYLISDFEIKRRDS